MASHFVNWLPLPIFTLLHSAATLIYGAGAACLAIAAIQERESLRSWTNRLVCLGLLIHSSAIISRWIISGHGPYMTKNEIFSSDAWILISLYLLTIQFRPSLHLIGYLIIPLVFSLMTLGLLFNPSIKYLSPSLRSLWLFFHVLFAKLAAAGVMFALSLTICYLIKIKNLPIKIFQKLPDLNDLDLSSYRLISFSFVFWSIMIASGAVWAHESWGQYWSWDPIEIWSLVTWIFLGLYLHLRRFFQWRHERAAWTLIACVIVSIITKFVIPYTTNTSHVEYFQ